MKFFLYTAAGSAFLLASTLVLGVPAPGRHRRPHLRLPRARRTGTGSSGTTEVLLFLGFMAAFAIKAPLFPFHTWLPDVHTEAPTAGSVVLAGVILKMGAYGFLRFSFELFPQASVDLAPLLLVLAVIGIIYGAIVAAMQTDLKRVIAYSSVAHMGFVVLGIFSLTVIGLDGARVHDGEPPAHHRRAVPRRRHALRAPAHPRDRRRSAASGRSAPMLGGLFLIAMFAGIGLPGFSGLHRRVPRRCSARSSCDRPYAIVAHVRRDPRRGLHALGVPARRSPASRRARTRKMQGRQRSASSSCVVPLLGAEPVPRPLPEAGARPHRAVGEGADRAPRAQDRLPRAGRAEPGSGRAVGPEGDERRATGEDE